MAFNPLKGIAQGIAGRALRKVSGNLPGLLGIINGRGSNNSSFAGLQSEKRKTKVFQFPLDVQGEAGLGNQGHYITFMINQQTNAKIGFGNAETTTDGKANMQKESRARKIPAYLNELTSGGTYAKKENKSGAKNQLNKAVNPYYSDDAGSSIIKQKKTKGSTISIDRPPTVRMDTAITLFMPQTVSTTYGVEYANQEVGDIASAGVNAFRDIVDSKTSVTDAVVNSFSKIGKDIEDGAINKVLGLLSIIPGIEGAKDVFQASRGFIKAPKMELFFRGVGPRKFQYTFKMIPKSREEMLEIRKIVASFKLNMLPEFADGDRSSRRLTVPNTFDIQYMYNGFENDHLHKISTCVLESVNVTYAGEGKYQTYTAEPDGAPPLSTEMTLNFQEMEIITKERVAEGF